MFEPLQIGDGLSLREVDGADAEELHALIEANRARLSEFMPWAAGQTPEDTAEFVAAAERQSSEGTAVHTAIVEGERIVGIVGVHVLDWDNSTLSLGYWIGDEHEGRGVALRAVRALCEHGFSEWGLNRIEIRAAEENSRSQRLAERLGFRQEGLLREAQIVNGETRDLRLYAVLADEWNRDTA